MNKIKWFIKESVQYDPIVVKQHTYSIIYSYIIFFAL